MLDDPTDPAVGYSMSQEGNLRRFNRMTGERKDIQPISAVPDLPLRFHWNAALAIDPFDPLTLYYGSQFLHRSTDRGDSWQVISPDLTTDDPTKQRQAESGGLTIDATGAENHTTILTIAPSPVERGVIWVGTDDGNVQLTRNAGASWDNLVGRIPGVPENTWVPHIEASKHDAGGAFVVFDDHRRGNWTPYIYQTTDYGRTWTALSTPEILGFVHTIEQDPVRPELLFLGTEFGMYVSTDGGGHWIKWTHGLPPAPVRALGHPPARRRPGDRHPRPRRIHPGRHPPAARDRRRLDAAPTAAPPLRAAAGLAARNGGTGRLSLDGGCDVPGREPPVRRAADLCGGGWRRDRQRDDRDPRVRR